MLSKIILLVIFSALLGCTRGPGGDFRLPLVYRVDIQQGNLVSQTMLSKLRPGMDKNKVRFIMGTPLLQDPFHGNRWDYMYSIAPGRGKSINRRVSLYFKDDKLIHLEGDVTAAESTAANGEDESSHVIVVPIDKRKKGLFDWFASDKAIDEEAVEKAIDETVGNETRQVASEEEVETKDINDPLQSAGHAKPEAGKDEQIPEALESASGAMSEDILGIPEDIPESSKQLL